jgi:uroporphyrinogen III methyltransferase/synthase
VENFHLRVDAVPEEYRAEAVIPVLGEVRGRRILLPRAAEARAILPQELMARGAQVEEIAVYRTIRPQETKAEELRSLLMEGRLDLLTFTSSSTVRNFVSLFPADEVRTLIGSAQVGCIGPITAETAREYGLDIAILPRSYTVSAFAEAIVEYFKQAKGCRP